MERGRGWGMVLTPLTLDLALNFTVFNLARSFFSTLQTDAASAGEGLDQRMCVFVCVCALHSHLLLLGTTPTSSPSPRCLACHHSSSEALTTWRTSPKRKSRPWLGSPESLLLS